MRVIGVDPGLRRTGWGVIETSGSRIRHVANGVCESRGTDLASRLLSLFEQLTEVVDAQAPEMAAVEHTFVIFHYDIFPETRVALDQHGLRLHGFLTPKYLEDVILPNVEKGLERSGRTLQDFDLVGGGFIGEFPLRGLGRIGQ